jgi:hypothetical protein
MNEDKRFYGVYDGICFDIDDPDKEYRIKLIVPQVLGSSVTEWARACLPVTSNSNHPDHKKHLASEVASLLVGHSATFTSSSNGTPSHTHTTAVTFSHAGNSLSLDHEHETTIDTDNKWNDDQEVNQTLEHTPHRIVPAIGQRVWVMFIAGDPNFPIWIGVQP